MNVPFHFPFHCSNPYSSPAIRDTHSVCCTSLYWGQSILVLVISLVPRLCSQFSEQRHKTSFNYSVALILVTFLTVASTLFIVSLRTTHRWAQVDKGSSRTFSRLTLLEAARLSVEGGSPYLPQQWDSITISAVYTTDEKCVQGGSRDRQVQLISVQYIHTRASSCWTETTSPTPPISLLWSP